MQRGWRYLSVSIDAPLLLAANSLWALLGYHPLQQTWLGLKLVLLVVYIVLGSFALKRGPTRVQRLLFFCGGTGAGTQHGRHGTGPSPGWLAGLGLGLRLDFTRPKSPARRVRHRADRGRSHCGRLL